MNTKTTITEEPEWLKPGRARIDARDLAALADCRRASGVRVLIVDGRAWVDWGRAPLETRRAIIERLLPLSSVDFFIKREDGRWHRPEAHLPSFDVPREIEEDGAGCAGLERVLLPRRFAAVAPESAAPRAAVVRLARAAGPAPAIAPRPASALRCRLDRLAAWADRATTSRIESLSAAWAPSMNAASAEVLVLGAAAALPEILEGTRYWGSDVLVPLGFCLRVCPRTAPERGTVPFCGAGSAKSGQSPAVLGQTPGPDLPAPALRAAVGAGPDDLLVFDEDGPELVPRSAFAKLCRASIRKALRGEIGEAGNHDDGTSIGPSSGGREP